jgi:C-terminal processing protease CtpA/Prc
MMNRISLLLYALFAVGLFTGCVKETILPEEDVQDDVNHWMEQKMRDQYLWYEDIPESQKLPFSSEPEPFFYSLLSKKDGKYRNGKYYPYSSVRRKTAASKAYLGDGYSFGFEFQYYHVVNMQKYGLMVLYVLPDSPASEAGLKRGDWIYTLNGKPVPAPDNSAELNKLSDTSAPQTLETGIAEKINMPISRTVSITSRPVTDNPVLVHKTLSPGDGQKKVGYLLYNHFTSGPEGSEDETFNNSLRSAFAQFKADGVSEFVLDLRFNGGGLVSCAQLLATMLAPEPALNDVLCYLTYNDKTKEKKTVYLDPKRIKEGTHGANLNLSRLFVITSERTASASEIVINGLSPYMELIQTGSKTEGKNVASVTIADDRYEWELHPIVSYLSNKDGFSDYTNGFPPTSDFVCDDSKQGDYFPLGGPEEYILKHILNYIAYGHFAESKSSSFRSAGETDLIPLYNSLDSKKTNGAAILPADFYRP